LRRKCGATDEMNHGHYGKEHFCSTKRVMHTLTYTRRHTLYV